MYKAALFLKPRSSRINFSGFHFRRGTRQDIPPIKQDRLVLDLRSKYLTQGMKREVPDQIEKGQLYIKMHNRALRCPLLVEKLFAMHSLQSILAVNIKEWLGTELRQGCRRV